ncbi:MFS transporter [Saccharothrix hoggarensis]
MSAVHPGTSHVQLDTADGMRGRLLALNSAVGAAAGAVGAPLLGWLCERIGAPETLVLAGVLTLLVTVFAASVLAAPRHRRAALAQRVLRRPHRPAGLAGHPHQPAPPAGHPHGPSPSHGPAHPHGPARTRNLRRRPARVRV